MSETRYFDYWKLLMGFDILDKQTGRKLTKGEFYRVHTNISEGLADGAKLPDRFELVNRPPFVPYVERNGKKKVKLLQTTINLQ